MRGEKRNNDEIEGLSTKKKRQIEWNNFLSQEHRKLVLDYLELLCKNIKFRECSNVDLVKIDNAIELIIDSIVKIIGRVWNVAVKLSYLKIDRSINLKYDNLIADRPNTIKAINDFKKFDESEQEKFISGKREFGDKILHLNSSASDLSSKKKLQGTNLPVKKPLTNQSKHNLFSNDSDTKYYNLESATQNLIQEEKFVQIKQSELKREVTINEICSAIELSLMDFRNDEFQLKIPVRSAIMFKTACPLFFKSFCERFLMAPKNKPNY